MCFSALAYIPNHRLMLLLACTFRMLKSSFGWCVQHIWWFFKVLYYAFKVLQFGKKWRKALPSSTCLLHILPWHLQNPKWPRFLLVPNPALEIDKFSLKKNQSILISISVHTYIFFSSSFRGRLWRSFEREGWIHRSVQLQRKIRIWFFSHLPLQSRIYTLGQCIKIVYRGRYLDWPQTSMQTNHLRSASWGYQHSLPLDEWHNFLAKFG